jgi:hypothetical protein
MIWRMILPRVSARKKISGRITSALPIAVSRAGARRQRTLSSNPTVFCNSAHPQPVLSSACSRVSEKSSRQRSARILSPTRPVQPKVHVGVLAAPTRKSLWSPNVSESGEIRPTFQRAFSEMTFAGSNPTCPATQCGLCGVISGCGSSCAKGYAVDGGYAICCSPAGRGLIKVAQVWQGCPNLSPAAPRPVASGQGCQSCNPGRLCREYPRPGRRAERPCSGDTESAWTK